MTEGGLETESRCRECLAIIKGEVTSNNLSKRRVRTRTHGVVGGRGLVAPSYPIGIGCKIPDGICITNAKPVIKAEKNISTT